MRLTCACQRHVRYKTTAGVMQSRVVRDSRAWDVVSGLCGRCHLPYREVAVVVGGEPQAETSGVVRAEDLAPTSVGGGR